MYRFTLFKIMILSNSGKCIQAYYKCILTYFNMQKHIYKKQKTNWQNPCFFLGNMQYACKHFVENTSYFIVFVLNISYKADYFIAI